MFLINIEANFDSLSNISELLDTAVKLLLFFIVIENMLENLLFSHHQTSLSFENDVECSF